MAVPLLILAYSAAPASSPCDGIPPQPGRFGTRGGTFSCPALLVALYGQTDRLMLRPWPGEAAVGLYGAAGSISALWIFVPAALVETARPLLRPGSGRTLPVFVRGWPLCAWPYSGMAPAWPPW